MLSLSLSGLAKHLNWTLDGRVEDVHVLRPLATEHLARPHLPLSLDLGDSNFLLDAGVLGVRGLVCWCGEHAIFVTSSHTARLNFPNTSVSNTIIVIFIVQQCRLQPCN